MTSRLLLRAAAASAPLLLLATTTPAHADGPLQVTSATCEQTSAPGYYGGVSHPAQMECDFYWSGGTGTVTASYTSSAGIIIANTYPDYQYSVVDAYCSTSSPSSVTIHLTDSLGATATGIGSAQCYNEVP